MPDLPVDLRSPEWLPIEPDRSCRTVDFVHLREETFRSVPFLDWRYVPAEPRSSVSLERLAAAFDEAVDSQAGPPPREAAYIFHTTFCGSTLLARALDRPGKSVAYKEPPLLTWLARTWADPPQPEAWPALLHLAHRLHSRGFGARERAVVKAHNGCSNLLADLLRDVLTDEACLILLYGELDSFLARTLEADDRTQWVHRFLQVAARATLGGAPWPKEPLTAPQEVALLWAMHILDFRKAVNSGLGASACALSQEVLQADPAGTIRAVSALAQLELDEADIADQLESVMRVDAKTGRPFSPQTYMAREAELQRRLRPQILEARRWLLAQPWGEAALSWPPPDLSLQPVHRDRRAGRG